MTVGETTKAGAQDSPAHPVPWFSGRRATSIPALAVAMLGFLAFVNSLWNGFVYDDVYIVVENPSIRHLFDLRSLFGTSYWQAGSGDMLYRPMVMLSYALNYALAGPSPLSYHLVNVLLHALNSALVYLLFKALFRNAGLAVAGAAAFTLHPIHTEAVTSIVGRAELLANAFVFLSWLSYLKWDKAPIRARQWWLAISVIFFAMAILSKEHAVVLIGLLVLTDLRRASEHRLPPGEAIWGRCRTAYIWYFLLLVGYLLARLFVLGVIARPGAAFLANPLIHVGFWPRFLTAVKVLGRYFWLLLVPIHLSSDYSFPQVRVSNSPVEPAVLAALVGLIASLALAGWAWRRQPVMSFGIAIFGIAILPVSNLLFPIGTIMAERLLYLPSLGFCLLLALAVTTLAGAPRTKLIATGAFLLLLLGYATRTVLRNRDWRTDVTLFASAVRTSPDSTGAHLNMGMALLNSKDFSGAQREFERSLEIYPGFASAIDGLGAALLMQGQTDAAARAHQAAIEIRPDDGHPHLNLGFIDLQRGRTSDALQEFRLAARHGVLGEKNLSRLAEGLVMAGAPLEAIRPLEGAVVHNPSSAELRNNLGLLYMQQGRLDDAQLEFEAAARLEPDLPLVQMNLGRVYASRGLPAQAEVHFKNVLKLQPGTPEVLGFLGAVLAQQGRLQEAEEALQNAVRLQPSNAGAHFNLGIVLAKQGKLLDARAQLKAALRLTPSAPAVHRALGAVLQQQGKMAEAQRELKLAEEQEKALRPAARE
jgi:tetratricopeptide (TPR) repeat protein